MPKNILIHDLTKPLPFKNNSVDCIYSSHTLEHLYFDDAKKLLNECFRVLKPGGLIRVVVPDLKAYANEYLSEKKLEPNDFWESKADKFLDQVRLRPRNFSSGKFFSRFYNWINDTASHKWMYDTDSLTHYLKMARFKKIKRRGFNQSKIKDIKNLEQKARLGNAVCLEAQK